MTKENKPIEEITPHANSVVIDGVVYDIVGNPKNATIRDNSAIMAIQRLALLRERNEKAFADEFVLNYDAIMEKIKEYFIFALGKEQFDKAFPDYSATSYVKALETMVLISKKMQMVL